MAMTLPHFWKLLKFSNVTPSFCCLASQRLQAFSGQLCFSSVSFSSVIWHTLFHPVTSYMTVNLRALASIGIQCGIPFPAAHQLRSEALSHLLQSTLGSLQLICSCWEGRLERFQFRYVWGGRWRETIESVKGFVSVGGKTSCLYKMLASLILCNQSSGVAPYRTDTRSLSVGGSFIFWRFFL